MQATAYREMAAAKLNLALHVTGRRADGYHLLDSLVTFADYGDTITVESAAQDAFTLVGRFAPLLANDNPSGNLVLKARDLLRAACLGAGQAAPPVAITLDKTLPVAAGIGGGSADAAATLRVLLKLWDVTLAPHTLQDLALSLGADVPMCLAGVPLRAQGIGEDLTPLATMPHFGLVIGNPLKSVSTPAIFKALTRRDNPPIGALPAGHDPAEWIATLKSLRNDLQPVAESLCPEIGDLCQMIARTGPLMVRMSGSGASCFGLYANRAAALAAEKTLLSEKPDWYFQAGQTISASSVTKPTAQFLAET
ncbi:4-(cytidine 5'-diphospho)-2-C-methyl-D-erythritol kinase [Allorhizobium taibaishanense]|uniref:4-diphosphocytidyl-2-C-methyl-D-erythritol kinase n=1 Tax=Allorhizobium taibaishanense TaxID=887144 RepID=A0A1Q9AA94_9HYPH|nr:4-(cytidine 5'-diphospho)-2-C-methyl-D-erythritol kinase [Allorhizobium taibaishanense]MBB4006957.1 4-diphosphocytidyl-2-C-methyl-D-erythritol kinase [Allorhizobium taibaishanense]OLP51784.1 4-(cytidine 5'-diphospho)-2-C-methyl-D-erythritol kinase [Allorhizobium taibaishanense]